MEEVLSKEIGLGKEIKSSLFSGLTSNRMKALKSLIVLVLQEVEFLENITPEADSDGLNGNSLSLSTEVELFEIELIRTALMKTNGNQVKAANLLGLKLTTLNAKIKRYGIDPRVLNRVEKTNKLFENS